MAAMASRSTPDHPAEAAPRNQPVPGSRLAKPGAALKALRRKHGWTLADVSRQDVAARTITEERVQPVGASPVDFMLSYDPADLRDGVDFAIGVRLQQGDKLLAINDTRTSVLGRSGEHGPVSITLKTLP